MKKLSALLCGLLLTLVPARLHAQVNYQIDKIIPTIVQTPEFQVNPAPTHNTSGPAGKWLEVEVQFETAVDTDELTFKYYIVVGDSTTTLLAGEVTHINVPKGRELYSVMYVSPRTLARLLPPTTPVTPNAIKVVGVQILLKGQVVAEKSSKSNFPGKWWETQQQVTGMVLNKNETPFAPLLWDRYEAIKSTGH